MLPSLRGRLLCLCSTTRRSVRSLHVASATAGRSDSAANVVVEEQTLSRRSSGSVRRHARPGPVQPHTSRLADLSRKLEDGPDLGAFLSHSTGDGGTNTDGGEAMMLHPSMPWGHADDAAPDVAAPQQSYFIETYGCQMNVSDTEIVDSVMQAAGYARTAQVEGADIILSNTCAIRENAEQKVWNRLGFFKSMKRKLPKNKRPVVGVLGCMAERLKTKLLESDRMVDLVAGPDAYRDLPDLIDVVRGGNKAANVQLSVDETYADLTPVRSSDNNVAAYLSIMRGCNNMCAFCIVPFTRGRERSREVASLEDEIRMLADQGFKEVMLLGQNVNSYHDASTPSCWDDASYSTSRGFTNMYKLRNSDGVRFAELLERVSNVAPEMRVRFTSPHPKDFPDELLHLMRERPNICNSIHLPAQSGSSSCLQRMRRGYTREAYLDLAHHIRETVPGVALSSDFISGFCDETEDEHRDTVTLMQQVKFEQAFMFAYSMRDKTHAYHRMADNVPEDVKARRLKEVIATFREHCGVQNAAEVGRYHVLLVEGTAKRSTPEEPKLVGRVDNGKRCIIPDVPVFPHMPSDTTLEQADALLAAGATGADAQPRVPLQKGDFVVVKVSHAGVITLNAQPVARTTVQDSARFMELARSEHSGGAL